MLSESITPLNKGGVCFFLLAICACMLALHTKARGQEPRTLSDKLELLIFGDEIKAPELKMAKELPIESVSMLTAALNEGRGNRTNQCFKLLVQKTVQFQSQLDEGALDAAISAMLKRLEIKESLTYWDIQDLRRRVQAIETMPHLEQEALVKATAKARQVIEDNEARLAKELNAAAPGDQSSAKTVLAVPEKQPGRSNYWLWIAGIGALGVLLLLWLVKVRRQVNGR